MVRHHTGKTDKMRRLVYFFAGLFFALLFFLAPLAKAQGTFTAASCNRSDVNAVINGPTHTAGNGDIIKIPAGSCTWTNGISVPSGIGITIIGAGTPNSTPSTNTASASCSSTVITDNLSGGALIRMTPTFGNATTRLSCIKFLPIVGSGFGNPININGTCTASGCPDLRIDNLTFPITWAQAAFSDQTVININYVFGVADHNTVGDGSPPSGHYLVLLNVGHSSWNGIGGWGDNSWASPDTFGSSRAFYLENNTFNYAQATDTDVVGYQLGGGGRIVCRFNNFASMYMFGGCTGHGTDTGGRMRGIRQWEIYDNTAVCPNGFGCGSFSPGRSGVGRNFENALSNSGTGFFKGIANLDAQRTWRANSPYGYCDGKSAWDQNDT